MTDTTTEMACSLDEEALRNRRALFRERLLPQALRKTRIDNGLLIVFVKDAALRGELQAIIALERQCCGFLDFDLTEDLENSWLLLSITGPLAAQAVLDQMESAFVEGDDPRAATPTGDPTPC